MFRLDKVAPKLGIPMDERASERMVADLEISAKAERRTLRVQLVKLSADGCMIDTEGKALPRTGSAIEIYLPSIGAVAGNLAWNRDGYAGVRFEKRLHNAVVKQIGFAPRRNTERAFLDQFGRPVRPPDPRLNVDKDI